MTSLHCITTLRGEEEMSVSRIALQQGITSQHSPRTRFRCPDSEPHSNSEWNTAQGNGLSTGKPRTKNEKQK